LIEKENDHHIPEAIRTLREKTSLDLRLKEKLTSRALKSEQDIKEGQVMERNELEMKLSDMLGIKNIKKGNKLVTL